MRHLLRFLPYRVDGVDRTDRLAGAGAGRRRRIGRTVPPDAAPAVAARYRAERRAVARRLHPDLGGDVGQYLAALTEVDRRYGLAPDDGPAGDHLARAASTRRRRRSGLRRRVNRAARATRQRLPRRTPGARRYAGL